MSGGVTVLTRNRKIPIPLSRFIRFSKLMSSLMSVLLAPGPLMNCSILHMIYVPKRKETPVGMYSAVTAGYSFSK